MVKLALLWHMHQPYYEDLATGEHILPWVRLHAIKDYWGMVNMLQEFPGVRATFNLVPSLLVQVQAFAEDRARDRHLELGLRPAGELGPEEASWLIANGFHAPYQRMIAPYPRYKELHGAKSARRAFDVDALRDLQVWHKLVWMDPDLLATDVRLLALIEKGSRYSESDKAALREVELETIRDVIPAYRRASDRGQIELSTSPFYHPILPLLCDSDVHRRAHPGAPQLDVRFERPEDARTQIRRALDYHEALFGQRPEGMWPSEGSVSNEVVRLVNEAGVKWIATDEDILARSLEVGLPRDAMGHAERPDVLYCAYRLGDESSELSCLFRDHKLSDRIGFAYQSWDAAAAAGDFVERVREAGRRFTTATGKDEAVVSVILDGENAWEHYHGGGRPFLRALYGQLQAAGDIQTVTMSEAASTASTRLPSVFPGSWINGDFYIWIGHRDDQRAWTQLGEARREFDRRTSGLSGDARERAFVELQIAEGSDWFWWYGDDHSSDHDRDFDELFRRHLRNAYEAFGANPPSDLYESNISTSAETAEPSLQVPGVAELPVLDGRVTSGLEWASAVRAPIAGAGGAMHQVSGSDLVSEIWVSITPFGLGLRFDGDGLSHALASGSRLAVLIPDPSPHSVPLSAEWIGADQIVEAHVPFDVLSQSHISQWNGRFAITICDSTDRVQERYPLDGYWSLGRRTLLSRALWAV
jgi:alpha-amylase/alpha-mannosidase (GH57 family)